MTKRTKRDPVGRKLSERMPRKLLPDFELAPVIGADPNAIRGSDSKIWGIVLAFGRAFNDLKNLHFLLERLRDAQTAIKGGAVISPPQYGQLSAMSAHLARSFSSIVNELMAVIDKHKKVVTSARFEKLTADMSDVALAAWSDLVAVALKRTVEGSRGHLFSRIRNKFGFHYDVDVLAAGYEHFFTAHKLQGHTKGSAYLGRLDDVGDAFLFCRCSRGGSLSGDRRDGPQRIRAGHLGHSAAAYE